MKWQTSMLSWHRWFSHQKTELRTPCRVDIKGGLQQGIVRRKMK